MTQDSIEVLKFQEEQLKTTLKYLQDNSAFYQKLFLKHNIDISTIKTLQDLAIIPTTEKKDLELYNKDFICVPEEQIIDYVTTSGTLGEPITFILTAKDLDRLAENEFLSMQKAGITAKDKVQLTVTLDRRFMAGLAYFLGLKKIGAGIIRVGPGNPELQWDSIQRLRPTVLVAVPSFILKLIEFAEKKSIDYKASGLQKIICIGEPIRNPDFSQNEISRKILEKWPLKLYSTYASTEMSTAFTECEYGVGGHTSPELIIIESLDDNNQPVKDNEPGELTITTLGIEGMPLLRYKTGDIAIIHKEECKCGRTSWRVGPLIGRKNHMIKYKGTTLYPQALHDILNSLPFIHSYFLEVYTNELGTDELVAHIAISPDYHSHQLIKQIKDTFRAKLRVAPSLKFVSKEDVDRVRISPLHRKPVDFIDRRKSATENL